MPKEDTQFKKGNPGKQKGAINKTTRDIKHVIKVILNATTDKDIQDIVDKLKKDKPEAYLSFIAKVAPKDISFTSDREITIHFGKVDDNKS